MPTTNRGYATPAHGSNVDTWDQFLNDNFGLIDKNLGGVSSLSVDGGGTFALTSEQYACGTIFLTGNITTYANIVFPAVQGWWTVYNHVGYNGGLTNYVLVSISGGNVIGCPPGEAIDVFTDGTKIYYRNLGRVGSYMDVAFSSMPSWISNSTIPPYLSCDGSTFSSGNYPYLTQVLNSTTLPDLRGRSRFYLNQGTNRITTAGSSIDGDTLLSSGGAQNNSLGLSNLPNYAPPFLGSSSNVTVSLTDNVPYGGSLGFIGGGGTGSGGWNNTPYNAFAIGRPTSTGSVTPLGSVGSINGSVTQTAVAIMPPATISGITLIRAA